MMKVREIWVYPIKSLRGISLTSAVLTEHGIPEDRRFMLLKVHHEDASSTPRYENMHVSGFPEMVLFKTSMSPAYDSTPDAPTSVITVTHTDPSSGAKLTLDVPLQPDAHTLRSVDVKMHSSPTRALLMPDEYSRWFSERFAFDVVLAYLGSNLRPVLGNLAPNAATRNPRRRKLHDANVAGERASSWLSTFARGLPGVPIVFGGQAGTNEVDEDYKVTFADCAPYLVVSATSVDDVSSRLPEGVDMDGTKFRPNLIVEGASAAWDEDYWGELSFGSTSDVKLQLTANCLRCVSLNVDYDTGKFGDSPKGQVLKKLMSDRRVDTGHKYSPVFGRYAFMSKGDDHSQSQGPEHARVVHTGDEVKVTSMNAERTVFKWPGMGITKADDLFPV